MKKSDSAEPNENAADTAVDDATGFATEPVPSPADVAVDEWFSDHFMGLGPRLDVEMYNIAFAAKEDLKQSLKHL